jgi:hypothetical protein
MLLSEYIYGFPMVLRVTSDYFPKYHQPTDLCNGDMYFLQGTDSIFKYYLRGFQLQRVLAIEDFLFMAIHRSRRVPLQRYALK